MENVFKNKAFCVQKTEKQLLFSTVLCSLLLIIFLQSSEAQPASTSGSLRLVGTVRGPDFSGAVIDDASGNQTFYPLHSQLPDGSQLIAIRYKSVQLKSADGQYYDMFVAEDPKAAAARAAVPPVPVLRPAVPEVEERQVLSDQVYDKYRERQKQRQARRTPEDQPDQ